MIQKNDATITLVCPTCRSPLAELRCEPCSKIYSNKNGFVSFVESDSFYEGKYQEVRDFRAMMPTLGPLTDPLYKAFRQFSMALKYERFFHGCFKGRHNLRILDIGCGGGWKFWTELGQVYGVDFSAESLKRSSMLYTQVVQANLTRLPFPDGCFDLVVSIDTLEHISNIEKDLVFSEIRRVLKPGGETAHYIVTEGNDPFMRFLLRSPDLYKKYFIDLDGHIGLEAPTQVLKRLEANGFHIEKSRRCWVGLLFPTAYKKYLDNEYKSQSVLLRTTVSVSTFLVKRPTLLAGASFLLGPLSDLFEWLSSRDAGLGILVHGKKSAA